GFLPCRAEHRHHRQYSIDHGRLRGCIQILSQEPHPKQLCLLSETYQNFFAKIQLICRRHHKLNYKTINELNKLKYSLTYTILVSNYVNHLRDSSSSKITSSMFLSSNKLCTSPFLPWASHNIWFILP